MFKLDGFVDDRNLAVVMHALAGLVRELRVVPVTNAKPNAKGGVAPASSSGTLLELFAASLRTAKQSAITRADVKLFSAANGRAPGGAGALLQKAVKAGLLKYNGGRGKLASYAIIKPLPAPKEGWPQVKTYKSYLFRGKDPAIDALRTRVEDHFGKRVNHKQLKNIELDGGPTVSCMAQWFFGATKRPQNATLEAAGRAIGLERVWVKRKTNNGG